MTHEEVSNFKIALREKRYNVSSMADESKLYKAENQGSGTFLISKPKRKKAKTRQTQLKNVRRGSRKG